MRHLHCSGCAGSSLDDNRVCWTEDVARDEKLDERSLYKEYETHLSYNASDLRSESYDRYGWIFYRAPRF
jgi:hypothetical protein